MTTVARPLPAPETTEEAAPREYRWTADTYRRAGDAGVFAPDVKLELIHGRVIGRYTESGPADYHWTADAFDRACDAGVFGPEARLELIRGRIIDRMGQGPLHFWRRVRIGRRLRAVLEQKFLVVDECPVRIAFDGEPVADLAVLAASEEDHEKRNPHSEDVALLVEVAVSSVEADLGDKALLYARAGIGDYWVVLAEENVLMVHREPTPDGYASVTRLGVEAAVSPLTALDVTLAVRDLLGPSG